MGLAALGGCLVDREPPSAAVVNETDVLVHVRILGPAGDEIQTLTFAAGADELVPVAECTGGSIVVEAEDGVELGRIDEPWCTRTELVITPAGTVTYGER